MNRFLYIALFVLALLDPVLSRFNTYTAFYSPEKVYLHFDRSCYVAGETIWFKGWVQESSRRSVLPPSNFIYAEILDGRGEAVVRVKIKRDGNGFPGHMDIPDILETGDYTLRAYTLWQLNNGNEYLFNDRIRIVGAGNKKESQGEDHEVVTEISFWPEGGRYFSGQWSVIGFKVVDQRGRSMDFEGLLVGDKEGVVQAVSTSHDGMGVFSFVPKIGSNYSVQDGSGALHPLPPPSETGANIQIQFRYGRYYISAFGRGGESVSLLLRDSYQLRHIGDMALDGTTGMLLMKASFFRPGINHLLIVNQSGQILAERLFFIRDDKAPVCKLDSRRINLSGPDGAPLNGNCSVSVIRGALEGWQQSDGIVSYMDLSSELKGHINNPYYYFNPEIPEYERDNALDILMIIQGWRYYDIDKIMDPNAGAFQSKFFRERGQELRGRVTRRHSPKMPKDYIFTFIIPKWKFFRSVDVDQASLFIIDSLDFPENTEMLINIGTSRLGASYLPKWDGDQLAEPFIYEPAPGFSTEVSKMVPLENLTDLGDTIQAAVVTAKYREDDVLVFGRSFGEDLELYKEMTLVEYISMKKAMFEYDGENMYNRHRKRFGYSDDEESSDTVSVDEDEPTGRVKLIVDDNEEPWWGFDMLRLEDLSALSISTQPDPVYGGDGGVVHIKVKPGSVRRNIERNPSLLYFVPLGYQVPRYFEEASSAGENKPGEVRNTIWWSPDVAITSGSATLEFAAAIGATGTASPASSATTAEAPYLVRIEGLSADGRPFSYRGSVQAALSSP